MFNDVFMSLIGQFAREGKTAGERKIDLIF